MSFYNGILNHYQNINGQGQRGLPGIGSGIGFKLDSNNNYDNTKQKSCQCKTGYRLKRCCYKESG